MFISNNPRNPIRQIEIREKGRQAVDFYALNGEGNHPNCTRYLFCTSTVYSSFGKSDLAVSIHQSGTIPGQLQAIICAKRAELAV